MLFIAIGMPGRFSEWSEAALVEIAQSSGHPAPRIMSDGLEQLGREVVLRGGAPAVAIARQPHATFATVVVEAGHPFMVTLEPPGRVVAALYNDQGRSLADAVRYTASSLATMAPLTRSPHALVVSLDSVKPNVALIARIAEHFEVAEPMALAGRIADSDTLRSLADRVEAPDAPSASLLALDDTTFPPEFAALRDWYARPVGDGALHSMWRYVLGEELAEVFWHPALFCLGSDPARPPTGIIDVTGSGRCLTFGPYVRLPAGAWSCSLILGCAKSAIGLRLLVEVFAGSVLGSARFGIPEAGVFEIDVAFVNSAPDVPLEVRLFTTQPAFEGEIAIGGVRMVPLKVPRLTSSP